MTDDGGPDGGTGDRSRITVVTERYAPEQASTARLLADLAEGLASRFDVGVLTGRPNYHEEDRDRSAPRREIRRGVRVRRLRSTRFDGDVLPLRAVNWLSFGLLAALHLLSPRTDRDATLVLSTPPTAPFAAWLARRVRGTPYVYLVHDLYPEMPAALGYLDGDGAVARLWRWAMRRVYRDADRVVVLGEAMRERLLVAMADVDGFEAGDVAVIHNWEDPALIEPMPKAESAVAEEWGTRDAFTLIYSGNLGRFHDVETAIRAVARLERRGRDDVRLLVVGEGADEDRLEALADDLGVTGVDFRPFQPRERLPETLGAADAALVGVDPAAAGLCVSSKLYAALAAGLPVLAVTGPDDDVARIVEDADCGERVEPGDAASAAGVLAGWADDPEAVAAMGARGRERFERRYSPDRAVERYEELLRGVVEAG